MAKKSKKQNNNLNNLTVFIAVVFGLASTAMIFLTAFVGTDTEGYLSIVQASKSISFTGLQASFGYVTSKQVLGSTVVTEYLSANYFSLFAYILPLISTIVLLFFKNDSKFNYLCAGGFIASAVFAFLSVTTFPNTILFEIYELYDYTLGVGSLLCGTFSIVAGLTTLYKIIALNK